MEAALSDAMLHLVLSLVVERLTPERAALCFQESHPRPSHQMRMPRPPAKPSVVILP
jgi:hypothetical protein